MFCAVAAGIPLGPYTLVRRLAKGGMAEIFLARKEGPEGFARDLVVKRILPHLSQDEEFTTMFRDEARLVAHLSHPNVVQVYDYGQVGGTAYLAMELVRGVDLRALTTRALERSWQDGRPGAVAPHHAAKLLSFVCEGLASAHSLTLGGSVRGLVHRDVTPSNVLVSFDGAVKVADFGIAKLQTGRSSGTAVGKIRGKYAYLSPEQSRGEQLDARSDLFNVGILLYETITGDMLFPHADPKKARMLSAAGKIPEPERLRSLPPPLRVVAEKALRPKAKDRYADALALRADLERYVRSCAEPSDTVELGRYVRGLFPDVLVHEQQGPRAAGTVPLTTGQSAVLPAPADQTPPFTENIEALEDEDDPLLSAATEVRTAVTTTPPQTNRRAVIATLVGIPLLVGVAAIAWSMVPNDAPPDTPPLRLPPRTDPAPQTPAELRVRSDPAGLTIRVDGEERGVAPLRLDALTPGTHRIEALQNGEVVRRMEVGLADGEVRDVILEAQVASLRVASQPQGAQVFIGEDRLGVTPLELGVPPGGHDVRIELEGHDTHVEPVRVAAGGFASISVTLREVEAPEPQTMTMATMMRVVRGSGTLAIATTPWCEVYLGSRRLGTTPLTNVRLPVGRHTLTLRSPGRAPRRHPVRIRANQTTRVRLAL